MIKYFIDSIAFRLGYIRREDIDLYVRRASDKYEPEIWNAVKNDDIGALKFIWNKRQALYNILQQMEQSMFRDLRSTNAVRR